MTVVRGRQGASPQPLGMTARTDYICPSPLELPRMFRFFEGLVDPYPRAEPAMILIS